MTTKFVTETATVSLPEAAPTESVGVATAMQSAVQGVSRRMSDRLNSLGVSKLLQVSGPTVTVVPLAATFTVTAIMSVLCEDPTGEVTRYEQSREQLAAEAASSRAARRGQLAAAVTAGGGAEAGRIKAGVSETVVTAGRVETIIDGFIDRVEAAGGKITVQADTAAASPAESSLLRDIGQSGVAPTMRGVFDD